MAVAFVTVISLLMYKKLHKLTNLLSSICKLCDIEVKKKLQFDDG